MKNIINISILIVLAAFCFVSCSKGSGGGGASGKYYIRMSVDGVEKTGVAVPANLRKYTAVVDGQTKNLQHLLITSANFNGNSLETINISLTDFTGAKSYSLAGDYVWTTAQYAKVASDPNEIYGKESGNVIITETNGVTVKGTFEFVARVPNNNKTAKITKGEFYLPVSEN